MRFHRCVFVVIAFVVGSASARAQDVAATTRAQGGAEPLVLTLQEAITRAQTEGLQARAARATRDAARQRDRAFGAALLPQLSLTGTIPSVNRSINPVVQPDGSTLYRSQSLNQSSLTMALTQVLPYTGGELFINSGLSRLDVTGSTTSRTWSSTPMLVGIRQDILRPNTQKWENRAQGLRAEAAERAYAESMEDVAIAAANAFFDYYTAKLNLENAATNAAVNDTLFTLNKGRFEVGKIGENDLLQSELALLRQRVSLDGARLEHDRALAALRLTLNLPPGAPLEIVVPSDIPEVVADTAVAVAQALRNGSQAVDLELQDVQAERAVSEAKYATGIGATVQASMGLNQTGNEVNAVYRDLLEAQRFNLQVSMPLVQWGGRSARIQAAQLDEERVEHTTRQTREQIAQEAHFAALQLAQSRRQLAIAAKADTVGAKRFEVAKNRYVIGRIDMDNLYQAQNEKDAALVSYLQSLRGYWVAYYRLRRVTMYDFATGAVIH
ncbi:MAG TPA: TolC family protein [Gemmatimonadaceae bacterium]|nr:TolC family protein [Gemmatimonadaceae bacterium]